MVRPFGVESRPAREKLSSFPAPFLQVIVPDVCQSFGCIHFRISNVFLCLISSTTMQVAACSQDEMQMAMIGALEATLDYGSQQEGSGSSNRIPYVRLLQSNLQVVQDFNSLTTHSSRRQMLVQLMEFQTLVGVNCKISSTHFIAFIISSHIFQCELKIWQKVEQLSTDLLTANKEDEDFLQSLAAVAVNVKDATDEMICPCGEDNAQQLRKDIFFKKRVAAPQRQLLASIAADSLRTAIDRCKAHARSTEHIFLLCRWY